MNPHDDKRHKRKKGDVVMEVFRERQLDIDYAVRQDRSVDWDARAHRRIPIWLWLSLPIAVLGIAGSIIGILFHERIYEGETANWAAQAVGQDFTNLVVFPTMLVLAFLATRGSVRAFLGWIGSLVYSVYSYVIYVFDIHFGPLFLIWVAVFGLSIYALVGGLGSIDPAVVKARFGERPPVRLAAGLLMGISSLFYVLWLWEVIPSLIDGTAPKALADAGVPTNPVHVLDLGVFLPTALVAGISLARRRPWGYVLAPIVLLAMVFIGLGIISLTAVLAVRGLEGTPGVGVVIGVVTLIELIVVRGFLREGGPGGRPARTDHGGEPVSANHARRALVRN